FEKILAVNAWQIVLFCEPIVYVCFQYSLISWIQVYTIIQSAIVGTSEIVIVVIAQVLQSAFEGEDISFHRYPQTSQARSARDLSPGTDHTATSVLDILPERKSYPYQATYAYRYCSNQSFSESPRSPRM